MHILQIEIENFKSFHGKTVIPFRRGFTTVSGPNGSGKSNIVDSLLFCLGLSTSRTMRAEKLTDLINNTSRKREATVAVTFSKSGQDVALPKPEEGKEAEHAAAVAEWVRQNDDLVTVTRRVREMKSGTQSSFYIDGNPTTLSEVHEYLAQFNVSPNCYNVMMQGDVASIVTMSATERRKILDEAAGIGEFERKIEQAQTELTTTGANIERHEILLTEIADRLGQLKEEREKALKYQSLKEQAEALGQKIQLAKLKELRQSLNAAQDNVEQSKARRKAANAQLDALKGTIFSSTQRLQELALAVKQKGEDQHLALHRQLETLRNHIARKQDGIDLNEQQINELKQQIQTHQQEELRQKDLLDTVEAELAILKQQENELLGHYEEQETAYKRLSSQFDSLTSNESAWAIQRHELRHSLEQVADELAGLHREVLAARARQERLEEQQRNQAQSQHQQESQRLALQKRYDELSKSFESLDQTKEGGERQFQELATQRSELWASLNKCKDKVSDLQTERARLDSRKRALDEMNFGRAVDGVMQANLPGVIGLVGQLVDVPADYATAMEVAMGGRLQNVVVENDSVAQRCIQFLQQQRAGRATFLPLNKLRAFNKPRNAPIAPGVIDFAINLVDFDPAYQDVFSLALGDTLIVEDMDAGRRLLNQYRMVTLDGSILEKTGAMSGGSSGKSRGSGMFQGAQLEKKLQDLEEALDEQLNKKQRVEAQLTRLEAELEQVQAQIKTTEQQHNRTLIELENLEKQLQELRQTNGAGGESACYAEQLKQVEEQLAHLRQREEQLTSQQQTLQHQLEAMDNEAQGTAVNELRSELTDVKFQMDYYDSQLRQVRSDLKQKQTDTQIKRDIIEEHKQGAIQKQEKIQSLAKAIEDFREEIATTQQQMKHTEAQSAALDEELRELQQERDAAQADLLNLERQRNNLERDAHQAEEQVLANQSRVRELQAQSASLEQQLAPQYNSLEGGLESALLEEIPAEQALLQKIGRLENQWKALEPVNMLAIKDYDQVLERQSDLAEKVATLNTERETLLAKIASYEELKRVNFTRTFDSVNTHFQQIYGELADGAGHLVLTNEADPLQGGLTIAASPRGKKLQRLEAMSGGEKSLTSLAFVFALQRTMPAPFYALDEVDQNLDGLNVEKLSNMVRREANQAQFIVVSLRKPMLENSDRTVGVTQKQNGLSKVTGIQFRKTGEQSPPPEAQPESAA